ncbi:hypothetical protein B0T09DRAFT_337622 [Sordaria sp. MPI-SDFR-AT-0083]|nr:hypothetical protein B0T09DRAFT_337622 [Sordaria sp. MPI-SDFR-AT-0083]
MYSCRLSLCMRFRSDPSPSHLLVGSLARVLTKRFRFLDRLSCWAHNRRLVLAVLRFLKGLLACCPLSVAIFNLFCVSYAFIVMHFRICSCAPASSPASMVGNCWHTVDDLSAYLSGCLSDCVNVCVWVGVSPTSQPDMPIWHGCPFLGPASLTKL